MIKYKDLYDYIVGVLYSLKAKGQVGYFSLKEIIEHLQFPNSPNEVYNIGKYLEAEGYVKAEFSLGDVFLEITPMGIVYIEDKEDSFLPTFKEFMESKKQQESVEKVATKLSKASIEDSKKPIILKINRIITYLGSVKAFKNSDIHIDAKILKLEIEKEYPDKEIVSIKLNGLEQIKSMRTEIFELKEYFSYFLDSHY